MIRIQLKSILLAAVCLQAACSGSSNSSESTCPNIAGTWSLTETEDDSKCGGSIANNHETAIVTQTGCTFTMMTRGGNSLKGTVNGSQISGTSSYVAQGETGTGTVTGTGSADGNSATVTDVWTYSNGLASCSGTTQIMATRVSGGPDAGPAPIS